MIYIHVSIVWISTAMLLFVLVVFEWEKKRGLEGERPAAGRNMEEEKKNVERNEWKERIRSKNINKCITESTYYKHIAVISRCSHFKWTRSHIFQKVLIWFLRTAAFSASPDIKNSVIIKAAAIHSCWMSAIQCMHTIRSFWLKSNTSCFVRRVTVVVVFVFRQFRLNIFLSS